MKKRVWISLGILILVIGAVSFYNITGNVVVSDFSISSYSCENGFSGNMGGDGWVVLTSDGPAQQLGKRFYELNEGTFNIKTADLETEASLVGDDSWFWVGVWSKELGDWVGPKGFGFKMTFQNVMMALI